MKVKGMILAAGLGSRLGELTSNTPKCLIEAGGKPLLQHCIEGFLKAEITSLVINTHYLADKILEFLKKHKNFDIDIKISHETQLYGTGGAVAFAKDFLNDADTIVVYNADVYSTIPINKIINFHTNNKNLATLAIQNRETSRPLYFNSSFLLQGWETKENQELFGAVADLKPFGFTGIQVISSLFLKALKPYKYPFSIITPYVDLAKDGEKVIGFDASDHYWIDMGTPASLRELQEALTQPKDMN
jgi:NDP-sugar pyrophosphorylase family protein